MKIALFGINMGALSDPARALKVAQFAEAAGIESLWAGEHIVLPEPRVAPSPLPADYPMLDPNICFAWLAGQTKSIRFGTGIIILPQRNPLVLAKEIASLDVLSNGRIMFGVGIGYLKSEFDALGIPFADKAARSLEYLEAMRAIWSEEAPSYTGKFVSFSGVQARPRPLQQPGPPVVFGGHVAGAFERSVTHAQGWYGYGLDLEGTAKCLDGLRLAASQLERPASLGKLEISVTPSADFNLDSAKRFADLGVDRLVVLFPKRSKGELFSATKDQEALDFVARLGEEFVDRIET
ncbi:MAG: putative F420-dependent oxidoreductase [Gammaproteobacteria bacterium]|jgi:probable F420-dependent oxidoreductase